MPENSENFTSKQHLKEEKKTNNNNNKTKKKEQSTYIHILNKPEKQSLTSRVFP